MDDLNFEMTNIVSDTKLLDFVQEYHETWRSEAKISSTSRKAKGKQKAVAQSDFERRLLGRAWVCLCFEFDDANILPCRP